jgi:alpha-L-fucosidase
MFFVMKKLFFCPVLFFSLYSMAQNHFAAILTSDTEGDIMRNAANIVPYNRQLRWQQLELVAFFHFGSNTYTYNECEIGKENPALLNPKSLNTEQWGRTVKDAGFKQVIITAKHHDGFCLPQAKATEHSVKNSLWKNGKGDVVREVFNACKKYNIGFGTYLSLWDRKATVYGTGANNDFFYSNLPSSYNMANGKSYQKALPSAIKKALKFETVNSDKIKIDIESSRLNSMISEVVLFYYSGI